MDFYHFDKNGEDFSSLARNRELLVHTHFASQETRTPPRCDADWAYFETCIRELKRIGYTGGLSFEGRTNETDNMEAVLTKMKELERTVTL